MIDGTENPEFLRSLQNAQGDTTNLAASPMNIFASPRNFSCIYIQSQIQGFVGFTTPVNSCKTVSSSTWLQTILKDFHFKVTKFVVVLDDEAASFTNDSVVHVEFFTADTNGWNVLRTTVEQVVGQCNL
ncbi:hypothetical protein ABFA07_003437 [Porites harrisoni]